MPRKLIRAAELLDFQLELAHARGFKDVQALTLAHILLLQLFDPKLYQFLRNRPNTLQRMEAWLKQSEEDEQNNWGSDLFLNLKIHNWEITQTGILKGEVDPKEQTAFNYQTGEVDLPLAKHLLSKNRQRSGFDPHQLIDLAHSSDHKRIRNYFELLDDTPKPAKPTPIQGQQLPRAAPNKNITGFVSQLLSQEPGAIEAALINEPQLAGHLFDQKTFTALRDAVTKQSKKTLSIGQIKQFADHLDAKQLFELYQASNLLQRLLDDSLAERTP